MEKSKAGVGGAVLDWQKTRDPRRLEGDASQPTAFHSWRCNSPPTLAVFFGCSPADWVNSTSVTERYALNYRHTRECKLVGLTWTPLDTVQYNFPYGIGLGEYEELCQKLEAAVSSVSIGVIEVFIQKDAGGKCLQTERMRFVERRWSFCPICAREERCTMKTAWISHTIFAILGDRDIRILVRTVFYSCLKHYVYRVDKVSCILTNQNATDHI